MIFKIILFQLTLLFFTSIGYAQNTESSADTSKKSYTAEVMPEYPGGTHELVKFIQQNINYPEDAIEKKIEGTVYVKFIVDHNGDVKDPIIVRGLFPSIDSTAIAIIQSLPKWTPAFQNGKSVDVFYTVPIFFSLEGVKKKKK